MSMALCVLTGDQVGKCFDLPLAPGTPRRSLDGVGPAPDMTKGRPSAARAGGRPFRMGHLFR